MTLCVDSTISYYESHAAAYAQKTLPVDMAKIYERFLKYLPPGARILDAGSGSGRDSREFLARGYEVDAFDASPTLAALSTQLTGASTKIYVSRNSIRSADMTGFGPALLSSILRKMSWLTPSHDYNEL
jgi:SAM-dependent methyltransferase